MLSYIWKHCCPTNWSALLTFTYACVSISLAFSGTYGKREK